MVTDAAGSALYPLLGRRRGITPEGKGWSSALTWASAPLSEITRFNYEIAATTLCSVEMNTPIALPIVMRPRLFA